MGNQLQTKNPDTTIDNGDLKFGDNDYNYLVSDLSGYTDEAANNDLNTLLNEMLEGVSGDTLKIRSSMEYYIQTTGKKYGESIYKETQDIVKFAAETNGDKVKFTSFGFKTDLGKDLENRCINQGRVSLLENMMANPSSRYEMTNEMKESIDISRDAFEYSYGDAKGDQNWLDGVARLDEQERMIDEFNTLFREKIIEYQESLPEEGQEYLVRGAILQCSEGTNVRAIDMPKSHGWDFFEKPLMIKSDYKGEGCSYYNLLNSLEKGDIKNEQIADCLDASANIRSFGLCKSGEFATYAKEAGRQQIRVEQNVNWTLDGVSTDTVEQSSIGWVCEPSFTQCWELCFEKVRLQGEIYNPKKYSGNIPLDNGTQLISTRSYLQCENGKGIVIPKTSGQIDTSIYGNAADSNVYSINTKEHYEYNNYNLTSSLNPYDHPQGYTDTMKRYLEHVDLYDKYRKNEILYDAFVHEGIPDDVMQAFTESKAELQKFEEDNFIERPFYTNPDYKDSSNGQLTHEIKGQGVFSWDQAIKKDPTLEKSLAYKNFCEAAFGDRNLSIEEANKIIEDEQPLYYETR